MLRKKMLIKLKITINSKIVHCSIQLMIVVRCSILNTNRVWAINSFINENPESFRTLHNEIAIGGRIHRVWCECSNWAISPKSNMCSCMIMTSDLEQNIDRIANKSFMHLISRRWFLWLKWHVFMFSCFIMNNYSITTIRITISILSNYLQWLLILDLIQKLRVWTIKLKLKYFYIFLVTLCPKNSMHMHISI